MYVNYLFGFRQIHPKLSPSTELFHIAEVIQHLFTAIPPRKRGDVGHSWACVHVGYFGFFNAWALRHFCSTWTPCRSSKELLIELERAPSFNRLTRDEVTRTMALGDTSHSLLTFVIIIVFIRSLQESNFNFRLHYHEVSGFVLIKVFEQHRRNIALLFFVIR